MSFVEQLSNTLSINSDIENASYMTDYMRGKFQYFGVKTALRRQLINKVVIENKEEVTKNSREITLELYKLPQRELHMCATEIFEKQLRKKIQ